MSRSMVDVEGGRCSGAGVVPKPSTLYRGDEELLQHRFPGCCLHSLYLLLVVGVEDGGGWAGVHQVGEGGHQQ